MEAMATDEMLDGRGGLRPHWRLLIGALSALGPAELAERSRRLHRALAEEAADPLAGARCDPVPLLIGAAEFAELERGLAQRARLLEATLADLYGPQTLLESGALPPALVFDDPAFLRPARCVAGAPKAPLLQFYAADLLRSPDHRWRVVKDRTDATHGIATALENRRLMIRFLPELFPPMQVAGLRPFFDLWSDALQRLAPAGENPGVAVLTPGQGDRMWFEHMLLSRELSCALVESGDLTVRQGALFLKTLRGLQRVNVLLRRLEGGWLDPLELHTGALGVPGLMDAWRSGALRVMNHPGAALVESPGFTAHWPALADQLLQEALVIPGASLGATPPSAAPCAGPQGLEPRPVMLRLFLIFDGAEWRAMPGGVALVLPEATPGRAGTFSAELPGAGSPGAGSHGIGPPNAEAVSKDVWVMLEERTDLTGPAQIAPQLLPIRRTAGDLPSRVADHFFWLGRYLERLENAARLGRAVIARLDRAAPLPREQEELHVLIGCLLAAGVVNPEAVNNDSQAALGSEIARAAREGAIAVLLAHIGDTAEKLRDRLSRDMYAAICNSLHELQQTVGALRPDADRVAARVAQAMTSVLLFAATVSGLAAENMVRGGGRLFLDLGRRVERAQAVARALSIALARPDPQRLGPQRLDQPQRAQQGRVEAGLRVALELCDSTITYRNRYLTSLQPAPVLDLVLADDSNPRSLAFQLGAARDLLAEIAGKDDRALTGIAATLLAKTGAAVRTVAQSDDQIAAAATLPPLLRAIETDVAALSDRITRRYFALLPAAQAVGVEDARE